MIDLLLLGGTNVGKSTLFNLLIEQRRALVADIPGLTKDWDYGSFGIGNRQFIVVDTPGANNANFTQDLEEPWQSLITRARLICIVAEGHIGLTLLERDIANYCRRKGRRYVVVVNKMDKAGSRENFSEFFNLSALATVPLVATNKSHRIDLCPVLEKCLTQDLELDHTNPSNTASAGLATQHGEVPGKTTGSCDRVPEPNDTLLESSGALVRLVILGKPNSGKSSLVNYLLGYDRLAVAAEAGTTHNSVTVNYVHRDDVLSVTDTAGVRRYQNIKSDLEKLTTRQSWSMVKNVAEVVLIMVDITKGLTKQDWTLMNNVLEMRKAALVCFSKVDLLPVHELRQLGRHDLMKSVPVVYTSSLTGHGVEHMLRRVRQVRKSWSIRIATSKLNDWLRHSVEHFSPPHVGQRRLKLKYIVQTDTQAPEFLIFSNAPIPSNYLTYLQGSLCKAFGLWGVPVNLRCRLPK